MQAARFQGLSPLRIAAETVRREGEVEDSVYKDGIGDQEMGLKACSGSKVLVALEPVLKCKME